MANRVDLVAKVVYITTMATVMIRNMDDDLRRRFKLICTEMDISMNKQAQRLIREFVEKKEAERKQGRLAL
jgi:plasmid stability protein